MPDSSSPSIVPYISSGLFCLAGAVLLWRWQLGPAARAPQSPARKNRLPRWFLPARIFLLSCGAVLFMGLIVQGLLGRTIVTLNERFSFNSDIGRLMGDAVFKLGILFGLFLIGRLLRAASGLPGFGVPRGLLQPASPMPVAKAALVGAGVFCVSVLLLLPISAAWRWLLARLGFEIPLQNLVEIFRASGSPREIGFLLFLAVVLTPVTEELVFRGALFRYLNTRVPAWFALLAPSVVFAGVHEHPHVTFPPLFVLAVLLSVAYRRTGSIATPIVAHALFNLNTIALLFLVPPPAS
ncbi:MAG: CPBP family intramembrane metalloprotease [Opitutaceae bacterium]|jgi:membrane protease YdiL (CAAX protease family)|nr:CPBP family intramembrane metalloprotease [Opitutaceae bacterium]